MEIRKPCLNCGSILESPVQGRRSVFQIGGAPGMKLLGEKFSGVMPFYLLETPFCEC